VTGVRIFSEIGDDGSIPEPEGVMVHQVASLIAVQSVLEVTVKVVLPKRAATF